MSVKHTLPFFLVWPVCLLANSDEIQTAADAVVKEVCNYSLRHPNEAGTRSEWAGGRAGVPHLIHTYPDGAPAYYVIPVLNSSGKILSLIGIDAEAGEWQWYTQQYPYRAFPLISQADAFTGMEKYLGERGVVGQPSPPRLVSAPTMMMYWWSVVNPPGGDIKEVFVPVDGSQRVYGDSEMKNILDKRERSPSWSPSGRATTRESAPANVPSSHDIADLPYHPQKTDWYCGEAALQMVFDYYGPLIRQHDIGDVANESRRHGTYTDDLRRAAHFSSQSTAAQNPDLRGYAERSLGYGAFENCWSYSPEYSNRYTDLKHLVSLDLPIIILAQNHYLVVKGYNDSLDVFLVHDPWPTLGPNVSLRQPFLVDSRWLSDERWGLCVSPWSVEVDAPDCVIQGRTFTIDVTVTYVGPPPFGDDYYPMYEPLAFLTLSPRFALDGGIPTKGLRSIVAPGTSERLTWHAKALDGVSPRDTIAVSAHGLIKGRSRSSFLYQDWIGGAGWDTVATVTNVFVYDGCTVDDDTDGESWGDGDGIIDAGEVIELSVRLEYVGDTRATQVYGFLSLPQDIASIDLVENVVAFGDALGDTILPCRDAFRFAVSEECIQDRAVEFGLKICDSSGTVLEENFKLFINCPTDIVGNGDFSSGDISCWSFSHTPFTPAPTWHLVQDPEVGQALRVLRNYPAPGVKWAHSSMVQTLHDADLSGQLLLLSFDVKVSSHHPPCYQSSWREEWPASILFGYEDVMGESRDLWRTFYCTGSTPDPSAEKLAQDTWAHRVYDVRRLAPTGSRMTQIQLHCNGFAWDVSFANVHISPVEDERAKGDVNGDGHVNVLDVVRSVKIAIGTYEPTATEQWASDVAADGRVDAADVVGIVSAILDLSP